MPPIGPISRILMLAFSLSFLWTRTAAAEVIQVPLDSPTIQGAIDVATNGDPVLVAPGAHVENIDFRGKAITVTSEAGPEMT